MRVDAIKVAKSSFFMGGVFGFWPDDAWAYVQIVDMRTAQKVTGKVFICSGGGGRALHGGKNGDW